MAVNKPLWGYSTWKVIWVHLEQPEVVLFSTSQLLRRLHSGNQEADTLPGYKP